MLICEKCKTKNHDKAKFCSECSAPLKKESRDHSESLKIASKGLRLKAALWDCFVPLAPLTIISILYAFVQIIGYFVGINLEGSPSSTGNMATNDGGGLASSIIGLLLILGAAIAFLWLIGCGLYSLILIYKQGQTIGKRKFGLKIVLSETQEKVGLGRYFIRLLVLPIFSCLFFLLGLHMFAPLVVYIPILLHSQNKGLHDLITNTVVVNNEA